MTMDLLSALILGDWKVLLRLWGFEFYTTRSTRRADPYRKGLISHGLYRKYLTRPFIPLQVLWFWELTTTNWTIFENHDSSRDPNTESTGKGLHELSNLIDFTLFPRHSSSCSLPDDPSHSGFTIWVPFDREQSMSGAWSRMNCLYILHQQILVLEM